MTATRQAPAPDKIPFPTRLKRWPHCLPKMGPECNTLLAHLEHKPLAFSQIKALGLSSRLGNLVFPNAVARLVSPGRDPRYEITPAGTAYLALLRQDGFLPPSDQPQPLP